MKTITFYSYKGGVGRSLALSNMAKRLSEFGKKVCLIDFDIEAPGLHHKFKQNLDSTSIKKGIVDYINYYNESGNVPPSIAEYVTKINFDNINNTTIDLIASGNIYSNDYWKKLFSIDWVKLFYKEDSQGVAFFVDLKEKIKKELKPDFLLIDSRTGITEISGITMSILADEIVLLAARNDENIEGIKQVTSTLLNAENNVFGKVPKINFVLSRIPYSSKPEHKQREILVKKDFLNRINTIPNIKNHTEKIFIIHSDPRLELNEKFMIGYEHEKNELLNSTPIALDYLELFEELTKDKLTKADKKRFDNIKEAEFLIKISKTEKDINKKIEFLKKAIELSPNSDEAFREIASIYSKNKNFEDAIIYIDKALLISPNNLDYLNDKGFLLIKIKKVKEAKKILEFILKQQKSYYSAINNLAHIYYDNEEFEKALVYNKMIIEYFPDFHSGYNAVANTLRRMKRFDESFEYIYKALELAPQDEICNGTLAEIYLGIGNENEFFKNLELSFVFGMTIEDFELILEVEDVYQPYLKNPKFLLLLAKYNLHINTEKFVR